MTTTTLSSPTFEAAGVRGSHVTTDAQCSKYGGDTTCILLTSSTGEHLLVDGGSGVFRFNSLFSSEKEITLFLSHAHLDHIQGLFFLNAFYKHGKQIHIHASETTRQAVNTLFSPPFFPITLDEVSSPPTWSIFPAEAGHVAFETPSFSCDAIRIPHPGSAYALLVVDKGTKQSILIANDMELQPDETFDDQPDLAPLLKVLSGRRGVDTIIIDAMFAPEEMATHKGWGHSDYKTAAIFSKHIHAKHIYLSHHSPKAFDEVLDGRHQKMDMHDVTFLRQHQLISWRPTP